MAPRHKQGGNLNQVRIIGGDKRRQLIRFPDSLALRPTPDRVRETLFNWLGQTLDGLVCLDLFAGSGVLGFEAASRGAARVMLVEKQPAVLASLHQNLEKLAFADTVEIRRADALEFAATTTECFDLVFLDPPYRQGWPEKLEAVLPRCLNAGARIYLETEYPLATFAGRDCLRQGKAGQVYHHLF